MKTLLRQASFQGSPCILHYCTTSATWIPVEVMHLAPPSHFSLFESMLCLRERPIKLVFWKSKQHLLRKKSLHIQIVIGQPSLFENYQTPC